MLHVFIRCSINGTQLKVFENGRIFRFGFYRPTSKEETWYELKGWIRIHKGGYKQHITCVNDERYTTSRIIWKAFHPEWDIEDYSPDNTIDHISRNSLDNHISNLRTADRKLQSQNRNCVINQKGYNWCKTRNKYMAYITLDGKQKTLGRFDTEAEAHTAYLDAKTKHLEN